MQPYYDAGGVELYVGHVLDVLSQLRAESVQCVVTSPPY
jgi:DNA modification methylase